MWVGLVQNCINIFDGGFILVVHDEYVIHITSIEDYFFGF
jgi:hypothetical protein